jgi:HK97 family phage major capsid protein
MVAEGGLKPLIDADFNVEYSPAKKVAGRMKASEEAISDFGWLLGAMENTLKRKHDIARQANILNGDGTGQNLKGINTIATPFNPTMLGSIAGSMPAPGAAGEPNNYDVLAAMYTAIVVQSEGTFMPNVVFVNPIDVLQMELTKDSEGRYLLPPFISEDGTTVKGVQIVSQPAIAAGTFVIGDMRLLQLRDVWGYTVRIGWENDDFSRNMVTMIGESRLHLYITDNDKRGIIKGAFADVKSALDSAV